MTDKELMQQALEALTAYDGTNGASQRKRVLAALRERLAQRDALDRMAANARKLGLNYEPVHSTQISKIWWDLHGDKLMAERIDPATIYQKPQVQPCAGRNCGSTNPNLHSAECFEDYEKATGMAQPEQEPVAYYLPHKGFYWAKPTSISAPTIADVEPLPLYTTPPKETK